MTGPVDMWNGSTWKDEDTDARYKCINRDGKYIFRRTLGEPEDWETDDPAIQDWATVKTFAEIPWTGTGHAIEAYFTVREQAGQGNIFRKDADGIYQMLLNPGQSLMVGDQLRWFSRYGHGWWNKL